MMSNSELRAIFRDTELVCNNEAEIKTLTDEMVLNSQVYCDYNYHIPITLLSSRSGQIKVIASSTFEAARKYVSNGKTAVLNFANPVEPGGGVKRGAMAQEETLCRNSNLYFSLIRPDIIEQYYKYHQEVHDYAFSDRIIYSPGVAVIKSDDEPPIRLEHPFFVDVITCAAPYNGSTKIQHLDNVLNLRIKAVLEVAIKNNIANIILGAWGCGVFNNPPQLVADEFFKTLVIENYRYAFDNTIFAIIKSSHNLEVFINTFSMTR